MSNSDTSRFSGSALEGPQGCCNCDERADILRQTDKTWWCKDCWDNKRDWRATFERESAL